MTVFCPRVAAILLTTGLAFSGSLSPVYAQDDDGKQSANVPFAESPYRVQLSVSVTGSGRGQSLDLARMTADIRAAVARMYGRMWDLSVAGSPWPQPGTVHQLERLSIDDFIDRSNAEKPVYRHPEQSLDKSMMVCVESTTAGFTVACREYDCRTLELTPIRHGSTPDPRGIALLAAQLIRDSFRPCLKFVRSYEDDDQHAFVEVQVQAGELPPPDPAAEQLQEGDVLRLFIRSMEKRDPTTLREIRPLWLNYIRILTVDREVSRGLATGILMSHSAVSPFGGRGRHLQHLALRQRPTAASSRVRLVNRGHENRPLACQRVSMVYKLRTSDTDLAEPVKLLSDRDGTIVIPLQDEFPAVWLYVYSGSKLLARVPYAPGLLPEDTIELPDDTIRLRVEGDLQLFQNDLVDAVAIREVHFSLAKRAAAEKRSTDLEQHLKDYAATPSKTEFLASLALIRESAQQKADEVGNRRARMAVEKLCRSVERSVDAFFSDRRRRKRQEEMAELRQKAKD